MAKKIDTSTSPFVPVWEQPYKIPDNWCWTYATAIFDIEYGKGLPTKRLTEKGYPVFGANGQIGFYNSYMFDDSKALMSCRGAYSGTMNLSLQKSFITNNSLIIDCKNHSVSAKFIYYLFDSMNKENLISGTAQPQVTVQAFVGYPIPLPPLPEQKRIVDRIESLFAKLDEAKEKAQVVVDGFELRKSSILHKAFTGELTKRWRKEHGVRLDSWEVVELSRKFDIAGGLQKKPLRTPKNNPVPYLTVANVFRDRIDLSEIRYFEVFDGELDKLKLQEKDILVVEGNGSGSEIGRCAMWRCELPVCIHQNHIIRLRTIDSDTIPEYVLYFLNSSTGKNIMKERAKTTAGLFNLSTGKIRTIPVPFATASEQAEIVQILDEVLGREQQAMEAAEAVLSQIDTMKKVILARAFRGELGTNDPMEEWAGELVQKMLKLDEPKKPRAKEVFIPKELEIQLKTELERKIIKLYLKNNSDALAIEVLMAVSSKKFEVMDALRNLEQRKLIKKINNGKYSLVR